ncbi:MAG: hypothetical protein AAFY16_05405 [Cyanobacteria bacterium J06642_3]
MVLRLKRYEECPQLDLTNVYRSSVIDEFISVFSELIQEQKLVNPRSVFNLVEEIYLDSDSTCSNSNILDGDCEASGRHHL